MVKTHDVDLNELLKAKFDMYHFHGQLENNHYFFDYKIQPGACLKGNAIQVLAVKGYPDAVVERANKIAGKKF